MKITITDEHIAMGTPNSPCFCPIALALAELPLAYTARVRESTCTVAKADGETRTFTLTQAAQAFVAAYDQGRPVASCKLEVWVCDYLGKPAKDWPACLGDVVP
jgi:hypothetical protein